MQKENKDIEKGQIWINKISNRKIKVQGIEKSIVSIVIMPEMIKANVARPVFLRGYTKDECEHKCENCSRSKE